MITTTFKVTGESKLSDFEIQEAIKNGVGWGYSVEEVGEDLDKEASDWFLKLKKAEEALEEAKEIIEDCLGVFAEELPALKMVQAEYFLAKLKESA